MYLLKRIATIHMGEAVNVEDGLRMERTENKFEVKPFFCGTANVKIDKLADVSKFKKHNSIEKLLLSYANEYEVKDAGGGKCEIDFTISRYDSENVEGYICFFELEEGIKTTGTKIWGRHQCEMIALIKEGETITFGNRTIEVINGKLVLYI